MRCLKLVNWCNSINNINYLILLIILLSILNILLFLYEYIILTILIFISLNSVDIIVQIGSNGVELLVYILLLILASVPVLSAYMVLYQQYLQAEV